MTEQNRPEKQRLRERAFVNLMDALLIFDPAADAILDCNQAAAELFGYSRDEMLGRAADFLHADQSRATDFRTALEAVRRGQGRLLLPEFKMKRRDGTVFPAEHNLSLLEDEFGRQVGWVSLVRDMAPRKQIEDALREGEARYRLLAENATDVIWAVNMKGELTYMNPSGTRMLGFTVEEARARTMAEAFTPASYQKLLSKFADAVQQEQEGKADPTQTRILEIELYHKNGTVVPAEGSFAFLRDAQGRPTGVLGIVRDITERKRIEEALKKSQENLRALSARIQSVREEERVSIAREIHDDLGQLLTGLKLDLSWFQGQLRADQASLKEKARAMNLLIDQTIGTVRRISTELRPRVLDDFGLIAALEWQAQEFANKTGIVCRFRSSVRKLNLKGDLSVAFFRIFQEALTNVARHSQATIVNASLKKDVTHLILVIADNGRGISEEETSRSNSLGLLGMRERALIFGGTIEILGKKGKGTRVTLKVPLAR